MKGHTCCACVTGLREEVQHQLRLKQTLESKCEALHTQLLGHLDTHKDSPDEWLQAHARGLEEENEAAYRLVGYLRDLLRKTRAEWVAEIARRTQPPHWEGKSA